jgi:hypothetical protein
MLFQFFSVVYFAALSVTILHCFKGWKTINDEVEEIWKGAVVALSRYYQGTCLALLRKAIEGG